MATKDYYPANTEWEVIDVEPITDDRNFKVKVVPIVRKIPVLTSVREVRTPYRPRIGQLIKLSRQDA